MEKERWELLAERPVVAQRKGQTQLGQGVTSGGQAKRNGVGREEMAETGTGGRNQAQGKT